MFEICACDYHQCCRRCVKCLKFVDTRWRSTLLWRAFFTTALVAVILQAAITYCGDDGCGLFGSGGLIMYNVGTISISFTLIELVPVVILGFIGGVLGSLFTYINGKIVKSYSIWHNRFVSHIFCVSFGHSLGPYPSTFWFTLCYKTLNIISPS